MLLNDNADDNDNPWDHSSHDKKPRKSSPNSWSGKNRKGDSYPKAEDIINKFQERLKKMISGNDDGRNKGHSPKSLIILALIVMVSLYAATGVYQVDQGEIAVVLRFGKVVRLTEPGLHYHIPAPIESHIVRKVDAVSVINSRVGAEGDAMEKSLVLTGDENLVVTTFTVRWKIKDIENFLFMARRPESTIRVAAERAIREIIGQTTAWQALTEERDNIGQKAQELLQTLLDRYKMGVQIITLKLQSVEPPEEVVAAFNDVQASRVDAARFRNEANAYRNEIIPQAEGAAAKRVFESQGQAQEMISIAEGEAIKFNLINNAYLTNPKASMLRFYFEKVRKVLDKAQITIIDSRIGHNTLPHFPLKNMRSGKKEDKNEKLQEGQ